MGLKDPLVRVLGDVVLHESCEEKSMEYKLGSRLLRVLDGGDSSKLDPATFPWSHGNIFSDGM
eukprot:NODE_5924_length_272_cov_8.627803_g5841_i0.p2 GENE.NODE_5924_length_272_cov_8.627803_g5841_i0~~NODE_5924_length_272_cov_8.627803_g5841_i0.p2  ORF type:complete len:70 (+),score=19.54 NODE_5924_length_272_cov_8.627803_g5841_i0:24-212(+)